MLLKLNYYLENYWNENGDPASDSFPIMQSLRPLLLILFAYLVFVLHVGPRMMRNRKPLQIRRILLIYNTMMACFNAFGLAKILLNYDLYWAKLFDLSFPEFGTATPRERQLIPYYYLYLVSKIADLFDTIFFVLRKKSNQVTALHVYHHFSIPLFAWIYFRFNSRCYVLLPFVACNTFCHTLMYTYYGLAALGERVQRHLWWKRYVTLAQLAQFVIIFVYAVYFLRYQRGYPLALIYNMQVQGALYFVLFMRFYLRSYTASHRSKQVTENGNSNESEPNGNRIETRKGAKTL